MSDHRKLGHALAFLDAEVEKSKSFEAQQLSDAMMDYVQHLHKVRASILAENRVEGIFDAIPTTYCHSETAYLAGNEDFFVARFTIARVDAEESKPCQNLSKHLNDCFKCFTVFTEVLRDFYNKKQVLTDEYA
ncbi:MAG: hypothetical protein ACE5IY_05210 [bacterium]